MIIFRIYVPERPLSPNTGRKTIPRDPYTLSNETDFDTMINTSVNKYSGLPHVTPATCASSSVTKTRCSGATANHTIIYGNTDAAAMEMTIGLGGVADQSAYKNWSTETTKVFETGNTSRMDETVGTFKNSNTHPSQQFTSELQSALNTVAMVEGQTRIFSGDEDTADMEFTACLTNNLGPLKTQSSLNATSPPVSSSPGDVTKHIDADMEFTLCNINVKPAPMTSEIASPATKVDSQAFLKKVIGGNNTPTQDENEQSNTQNATETVPGKKDDVSTSSFKIDAQAFLSKLMTGAPSAQTQIDVQNVDTPVRERTTTEGSEDMEFTACINQLGTVNYHVPGATPQCGEKTRIFDTNEENMEFTTCITQTMKDVNNTDTEHSPPISDKTKMFSSTEENMEFTTCINQTMKDVNSTYHSEDHSPPMVDKTKIFNSNEENMEFTTCITETMKKVVVTQVAEEMSVAVVDKTKIFEEDNMEFTTCLGQAKLKESKMDISKDIHTESNTPKTLDVNQDNDDTEIILGKTMADNIILPENTDIKAELNNVQVERTTSPESAAKSRKRSHPNVGTEVDGGGIQVNEVLHDQLFHQDDKDQAVVNHNNKTKQIDDTEDIDMISEETEPKFLDSPVREQEVTTGLKGLMSKVKKARKSIEPGETTTVFNGEMTLAQMDLTTCTGGIESRENTAKIPSLGEIQVQVRYFLIF